MTAGTLEAAERTRLVFVIDSLRQGGAERHLVRLVAGLQGTERWSISVYCVSREGMFLAPMQELGVDVAGLDEPWSKSPGRLLRSYLDLYRYLRKRKPDIVHCYLPTAGLIGATAARLAGVPNVITTRRWVHGYHGRQLALYRAASWVTDRTSDAVVAVCEAARRQAIGEGTDPEKIVTVYNAVEASANNMGRPLPGIRPGRPIFGFTGALHPRKGLRYLIAAMPAVVRRFPEALCLIAGDGPERHALECQSRELGVEKHVQFLGNQEDVAGLLQCFDVFVLPSRLEGMPNALLEAMAVPLPVIASSVGGVPELVEDGVSGVLVRPESSMDLSEAMIALASSVTLRKAYAREARSRVERIFSPDQELTSTESVYDHLPGRGKRQLPARAAVTHGSGM